jgi:hypothetical protein
MNMVLRASGFAQDVITAQGFCAAASSMLNEIAKWDADTIEPNWRMSRVFGPARLRAGGIL